MGYFDTPADMRTDILFRAGESTVNTSGPFYTRVLEYINRAYLDLCRGNGPLQPDAQVIFRWAIKHPPQNLTLQPKYSTGTISVTNNNSIATVSQTISSSVSGYHLIVDGETDVFRVTSHTAGTDSLTLDSVYTGDTSATATFKLVKLEYTIGNNDIMKLISPMRIFQQAESHQDYKIYGLQPDKFDELFPIARVRSGIPTAFKIVRVNSNNVTVVFNRYMETDLLKVEFDYTLLPTKLTAATTTDNILVPDEYRYVINDWALAFIFKDKNDNRYADALGTARAGWQTMVSEWRYDQMLTDPTYAQVIAREDDFGLDDRLIRTESGLILGYID